MVAVLVAEAGGHLFAEEVGVGADAGQWVAQVVGDDAGESDEFLLALP
jgi:hypothetical protein